MSEKETRTASEEVVADKVEMMDAVVAFLDEWGPREMTVALEQYGELHTVGPRSAHPGVTSHHTSALPLKCATEVVGDRLPTAEEVRPSDVDEFSHDVEGVAITLDNAQSGGPVISVRVRRRLMGQIHLRGETFFKFFPFRAAFKSASDYKRKDNIRLWSGIVGTDLHRGESVLPMCCVKCADQDECLAESKEAVAADTVASDDAAGETQPTVDALRAQSELAIGMLRTTQGRAPDLGFRLPWFKMSKQFAVSIASLIRSLLEFLPLPERDRCKPDLSVRAGARALIEEAIDQGNMLTRESEMVIRTQVNSAVRLQRATLEKALALLADEEPGGGK
jgi:hypothetical protein